MQFILAFIPKTENPVSLSHDQPSEPNPLPLPELPPLPDPPDGGGGGGGRVPCVPEPVPLPVPEPVALPVPDPLPEPVGEGNAPGGGFCVLPDEPDEPEASAGAIVLLELELLPS